MPKISELASASGSVNFTTVVPIVENATTKKAQIPSLLSTVYKNAGSFNWAPARTPAGGSSSGNFLFTNSSGTKPVDIYCNIDPTVNDFHTLSTILKIPSTSTIGNAAAVVGLVENNSTTTCGVGLQGIGKTDVSNSSLWGINTLLQDAPTRGASLSGAGTNLLNNNILIGAELDFNVMNSGTLVLGVSVGGNTLVQPTSANAYLVNAISAQHDIKWNVGFWSMDGCAKSALIVGASDRDKTAMGGAAIQPNQPSQDVYFQSIDSGTNKKTAILRTIPGGSTNNPIFEIRNVLSLDIAGTGNPYVTINGTKVLTNRQTGWTSWTGTPVRSSKNADSTPTIGSSYNQTEIQNLRTLIVETRQALLAIQQDLIAHGLIGT